VEDARAGRELGAETQSWPVETGAQDRGQRGLLLTMLPSNRSKLRTFGLGVLGSDLKPRRLLPSLSLRSIIQLQVLEYYSAASSVFCT
jgi:hypothetical protein